MRSADCDQKISRPNDAPPRCAAGTAHASAIAAATSTASAMPPYQRPQWIGAVAPPGSNRGRHHGASSANGSTCSSATGPLVRMPSPSATPTTSQERHPPCRAASITAPAASNTKQVSTMSNITAPVKTSQNSELAAISAAIAAIVLLAGASWRANRAVSTEAASANSAVSSCGHQALTPSSHQPALISQNSSGGLSPYDAPLSRSVMGSPDNHISHATVA